MAKLASAPVKDPYDDPQHKGFFSSTWVTFFSRLLDFVNTVTPRAYPTRTETANYTIEPTTDCIIKVNSTSGNKSVTVPDSSTVEIGQPFCVKKTVAANTVTIQSPDSKTFDGAATITLTLQYEYVWFYFDGTEWSITG